MIPREEQAWAILHAKEWELSVKYFGEGDLERLKGSFTVTAEDLLRYIEKNGYPQGWWRFEEGSPDGLYTVQKHGGWVVYHQERGAIDHQYPERFQTKDEAVYFVLEKIYLGSGG